MSKRTRLTLVVIFGLALIVAAPASAKDKGNGNDDFVSVGSSGSGIAPGAPERVKLNVQKTLEGKGTGLRVGADITEATRQGPQAFRRINWTGCRTYWARREANHFLGYNLWRYYQQVSFCSNGFSIYSWSRDRWAEVNFPGWRFDGHIGSNLGGTTTQKTAFTQGAFSLCTGFCTYYYPWISQTVYVDGGHSYNTGGS